ncbi:hypothetical protein TH63_01585 [Rufibacter radiotolerans]|uniref:Thioredoxin domain-containing protein n=1 Tax=Rufibacter radiotolerans TaxID=1379910 RepID=A0A0H4VL52_9BACT|nr:hypothetical protein [Rufibacter radiotolerans]AKQ44617.1 hypothetical protein TH63_01585 [Rufibacter radiotolerans]
MKPSLFVYILSFLLAGLLALEANAQKIKYETGTLEEVLAKAKQAGKPVFINLVPPVSLPGKLPENRPLTNGIEDPQVMKALNDQFLNVQVLHNSPARSKLAQQYSIKEYPTYLFLSPDGHLIHRNKGYSSSPTRYLNDIKAFKEKAGSTYNLSYFQREFDKGRKSPDFLEQYITLRTNLGLPTDHALLEAYVDQLPVSAFDNFSTVQFILEQGPIVDSKAFVFSRSNKTIMDSVYKTLPYTQRSKINNTIIGNTMRKATQTKDKALAQKGATFARSTWNQDYTRGQRAYQSNMVSFYKSIQDTANYLREAVTFYDRYYMAISEDSVKKLMTAQAENRKRQMSQPKPTSGGQTSTQTTYVTTTSAVSDFLNQLNNAAFSIYETGTRNPTYLTKAMLWSKRTVEISPASGYYDTLAHLLYRLELYAEAEAMQQKAVDLAGKEKQSSERFRQSLQKIKNRTL